MIAAVGQERTIGLRDNKGSRRQRAGSLVAVLFEAADPVLADMIAPHGALSRVDGIAFDRLTFKSVSVSRPVFERP